MHQVLFGSALLTSFLGGVVALLAPCYVPVMLPTYLPALPALAHEHREGRGRRGNLG